MKMLVFSLAVLFIAVIVALTAMEDPGYVLIAVGEWTVETTLALTVVIIVVSFALLYYSIRGVIRALGVPGGVRQWRKQRREHKALQSLTRGLIDLAEGRWSAAEKKLLKYRQDEDGIDLGKVTTTDETSLLNYLAAARAAQAQGAIQRRDDYLKLAHELHPSAAIVVGLTQAELQLNQNQLEQALATLRHLHQLSPKHPQVLQALARLYQKLGDWERVLEMIPQLRKLKVMKTDAITELSHLAYLMLLQAAQSYSVLSDVWTRMPEAHRESENILTAYVTRLLEMGESNLAEPLLRHALHREFSETLLSFYGKIECVEPTRQLALVESLLTDHQRNPMVLLTAGRLSLRNKLWGKARSYLEASINAQPNAEAYNELGNLLERMGESAGAAECFRAGLSLVPGCEQTTPINMELAANPAIALSNEAMLESESARKSGVAALGSASLGTAALADASVADRTLAETTADTSSELVEDEK